MDQAESRLDLIFAALSDPTRRAILDTLTSGSLTVSELAQPFNITLPGMIKHLKVLETATLISKTRLGRQKIISLNPEGLAEALAYLASYER